MNTTLPEAEMIRFAGALPAELEPARPQNERAGDTVRSDFVAMLQLQSAPARRTHLLAD